MRDAENQDALKNIVSLFKEDYTTSTKALILAKVVKEWIGIIFGVLVFTAIIAFFLFAFIEGIRKHNIKNQPVSEAVVRSAEPGSRDQQVLAEQKVAPHMKDLLEFLSVTAKSLSKRQEIFETLTGILSLPQEDNQKALEQKLTSLSTIAKRCTIERGRFVSHMAKNPNPFEGDITHAVQELLHDSQDSFWEHSQAGVSLDPAIETANWDRLCTLCAREVEKANAGLLQALKQ